LYSWCSNYCPLTVCSSVPQDPEGARPAKKPAQPNQRAGSSDGEDVANCTEYEIKVHDLSNELAKEKPSRKTVRTLMKETFAGTRHWVLTDPSTVTELSYKKNSSHEVKYASLSHSTMHYIVTC